MPAHRFTVHYREGGTQTVSATGYRTDPPFVTFDDDHRGPVLSVHAEAVESIARDDVDERERPDAR